MGAGFSRHCLPESLLLKKPTLAVEHEGGKRLEVGSRFYRIIHDWIARGCCISARMNSG